MKLCTFSFLSFFKVHNPFIRAAWVFLAAYLLLNILSNVSQSMIKFAGIAKYHEAAAPFRVWGNNMQTTSSCSPAHSPYIAKWKIWKWSSTKIFSLGTNLGNIFWKAWGKSCKGGARFNGDLALQAGGGFGGLGGWFAFTFSMILSGEWGGEWIGVWTGEQ